jgi:hypothetical protein
MSVDYNRSLFPVKGKQDFVYHFQQVRRPVLKSNPVPLYPQVPANECCQADWRRF